MKAIKPFRNERGAALVIGLMFLAIVAMLGATAVVLTTTDMQIGANYRASAQALQDADAGVNYVIAKMEAGLKTNPATFTMPANKGDPTDPNDPNSVSLGAFTAPTGFGFSYKQPGLTKIAENPDLFTFTTLGAGPSSSAATLITTVKRKPAIMFGAFGDKKLDLGNTAAVYSYSHSANPSPGPGDSTGEGDVGSNQNVILRNNSIVDGDVALGEDTAGNDAALTDLGGVVSGTKGEDIDRVDPDPLGVVGGEYAADFVTYSTCPPNDNCNGTLVCDPSGAISGTDITLGNNNIMTLKGKAGGSNYYFDDITLKNSSILYIDTTNGPVYIYLTGELNAVTSSNVINTTDATCSAGCCTCAVASCAIGAPSDFAIFANSQSSTDKISIGNSVTFSGLIYAPYLTVRLDNSADIFGAILGSEVEIVNSVKLYYDTDMAQKYTTNDLIQTTWRDVRN